MSKFFFGLDLGQSNDPTALAILEKIPSPETVSPLYHVRHLERLPLGTSYLDVVHYIQRLTERPAVKGNLDLALDATGVGAAVVDMFDTARLSCPLYAIYIHGGDNVTREGDKYRVPKRDLVSVVQVLLQSARLQIADALPEAQTLVKELLNFKVKIDPLTAHDSYSAWRENIHDDLVLAVALACWTAEKMSDYQSTAGAW